MFKKLELLEDAMHLYDEQIISFLGQKINTKWYIDLYTTFGEED